MSDRLFRMMIFVLKTSILKKKVSIHIGEYYASREPAVINTFLGSCVAVCLLDRKNKIGGMNHILVPGRSDLQKYNASARYSINAMELLMNAMMKLGAKRKIIEAKVFGGASVIPGISAEYAVGSKISEFVVSFLKKEKIRIIKSDLGGYTARKIYLHTDTGDVFLRRSHSMKSSHLAVKEQKKLKQLLKKINIPGGVTLFD